MVLNPRVGTCSYVAFLRGINSGQNPAQRMDNLRKIFEDLGFQNVQTVIASGNVLFEADFGERQALEARIEKALLKDTGIDTTVIIRTRDEIQDMVKGDPFGEVKVSSMIKPYATFLKVPLVNRKPLPGNRMGYSIIAILDTAVFSVVDLSSTKTPALMRDLEAEFGKDITTRSWATVLKIAARFRL
jgi:uncharacterized protein (DUF1697 family)